MQSKIQNMARLTLTITILAAAAVMVSLAFLVGGKVHVPLHIFVTFAVTGAAAGVGWVAITCTKHIVTDVDQRFAQLDERVDKRINSLVNDITETRLSLSEFATCVSEYGDQRSTAARLDALQSLAHTSAAADIDRVVTRIGRQASR